MTMAFVFWFVYTLLTWDFLYDYMTVLFSIVLGVMILVSTLILLLRRPRSKPLAVVTCLAVASIVAQRAIDLDGPELKFKLRQGQYQHFVNDILSDQKVRTMSNYSDEADVYEACENLLRIDRSKTSEPEWHTLFSTTIHDNGISFDRLKTYLATMRKLGIIQFEIEGNRVVFLLDGILDNEFGLMYLIDGQLPATGSKFHGCDLTGLQHLSENWYFYWTT